MTYNKLFSTLFVLIFCTSLLFSQTSLKELNKNKNITWAGEIYVDYSTTLKPLNKKELAEIGIKGLNGSQTLKLLADDINNVYELSHTLATKIGASFGKKFDVYKDDELRQKLSEKEWKKAKIVTDTIMSFNPETFDQEVSITTNEIDFEDIRYFTVKQYVYYDSKDVMFRAVPISIAPMKANYNDEGKYVDSSPMFWMPVGVISSPVDLSDNNITWAKRLFRSFEFKLVKKLKGSTPIDALKDIFKQAHDPQKELALGSVFDYNGNQLMSKKTVLRLGIGQDTIITFDENTFEEVVKVVDREIKFENIKEIRFLQDWHWNAKESKLYIRPVGFAPIIERYDHNKNFLNSGAMFTRREDFVKK